MRALSAVLPLLLSREDCRGFPLKRACCALHTCARNCSVGVRPLHGHALCQQCLEPDGCQESADLNRRLNRDSRCLHLHAMGKSSLCMPMSCK